MFAYGNVIPPDMPSKVRLTLTNVSGPVIEWDVNNEFGVVVTPGQDIWRILIIAFPDDPDGIPGYKKPMRLLEVYPWERIFKIELEYAGPPSKEPILKRESERVQTAIKETEELEEIAEEIGEKIRVDKIVQ